jgi:recombination protein RecT
MSNNETQLAERPASVKEYLALPAYKARFGEVLGARAPQFMASLITLTNDPNLSKCEPKSVIASAMIAAVLDFPIEKSLGFAHIVPYGNVAQFQMAAKGYVQLALRSGQYQRLNAKAVNAAAFGGYDDVGEPVIRWELIDDTMPAVGYVVAWRLSNGFTKIAYWSKAKVEAHALQFSQAYKAKKQSSPWFTSFDKMALKTVVMNELRSWGVLSVQMQNAMKHDNAVIKDVDAEPEYIDNAEAAQDVSPGADGQQAEVTPTRAEAPARRKKEKGVNAAETAPAPQQQQTAASTTVEAEIVTPTKPADAVPAPVAEKTVTPEAAPVTAAEVHPAAINAVAGPAPVAPRAFLRDGEIVTLRCTTKDVKPVMLTNNGAETPSASIALTGEFNGTAYAFGAGTKVGAGDVVLNDEWKTPRTGMFTLRGKANPKLKVNVFVDKFEPDVAATTAEEV